MSFILKNVKYIVRTYLCRGWQRNSLPGTCVHFSVNGFITILLHVICVQFSALQANTSVGKGRNPGNSLANRNLQWICEGNIFVANPFSQIKNTRNSLQMRGKTFSRKFATEHGSSQICDGKGFVANCDGKWFLANLQ